MLKFYPRGGGAVWHVVRQRNDIFSEVRRAARGLVHREGDRRKNVVVDGTKKGHRLGRKTQSRHLGMSNYFRKFAVKA